MTSQSIIEVNESNFQAAVLATSTEIPTWRTVSR